MFSLFKLRRLSDVPLCELVDRILSGFPLRILSLECGTDVGDGIELRKILDRNTREVRAFQKTMQQGLLLFLAVLELTLGAVRALAGSRLMPLFAQLCLIFLVCFIRLLN